LTGRPDDVLGQIADLGNIVRAFRHRAISTRHAA
jgi:hypothetical protein